MIFDLYYTSDWRVVSCLLPLVKCGHLCFVGALSAGPLSSVTAQTLLPCAGNVHDPTSIREDAKERTITHKRIQGENGAHMA